MGVGSTFFGGVVGRVCHSELRLSGASVSDAGASFLDLRLSKSDGFVRAGGGLMGGVTLVLML